MDDEMIDIIYGANKIWDESVPMSDEQIQEIISKKCEDFILKEKEIEKAAEEASVIEKEGESMVITEIVEEPGRKQIYTESAVVEISAEVHHRDCSQPNNLQKKESEEYESETTITASENEDITPGQRSKPLREDSQLSVPQEERDTIGGDCVLEISDKDKPQLSVRSQSALSTTPDGSRQKRAVSADEDSDNVIGSMNIGSFVNRMIGFSKPDKKKVKNKE